MDKGMHVRKKYSKYQRRSFPFCYLMIAVPVIHFAIFWVGVNSSSVALTFQNASGEFTWNNLQRVFDSFAGRGATYNLGEALGRSFTLYIVGQFFCFPISVITTYMLYRRIFGHYVFRVCYMIPGLMGSILWTTLIRYMMQYDGFIVQTLLNIGINLPEGAVRNGLLGAEETSFLSLLILDVVMSMVGNNLVLTGAFSRIPEELYESAELDGAGFWTVCFKIAIPCVWSTITTLLIFGLCSIFTRDCGVFLYSGGDGEPGMSTIGFILYRITLDISLSGGNTSSYGFPAAIGFVLTCMTLPIVLTGRWILNKIQDAVEV